MNEQEWTIDGDFIRVGNNLLTSIKDIVAAHKAALTAERDYRHKLAIELCKEQKALAAERGRCGRGLCAGAALFAAQAEKSIAAERAKYNALTGKSDEVIEIDEQGKIVDGKQEWTVARLASYVNRDGKLDDKRLLSDINAALTTERNYRHKLAIREADDLMYRYRNDARFNRFVQEAIAIRLADERDFSHRVEIEASKRINNLNKQLADVKEALKQIRDRRVLALDDVKLRDKSVISAMIKVATDALTKKYKETPRV